MALLNVDICSVAELLQTKVNMLVHGYNAADLLSSTVISIPKNARGDMSKSDNYRGISFCNCICKLFDVTIMNNNEKMQSYTAY